MNISALRYVLVCFVTCVAFSVFAADPVDFGEMEPDKEYEYEAMVPVMGHYTPTSDAIMRCYSSGDVIHPYEDEDHTAIMTSTDSFYGANGEKVRVYTVHAGQTIYFYNGFPFDRGTFRFVVGKEQIKLGGVYPSPEDGYLSISNRYRAEIIFNIPIKCSKCTVQVGDQSAELNPDVKYSAINVNWFSVLRQWYHDGMINEGDEMTVTITGIRDVNDSANRPDFGYGLGKLVLKYKMAARPAELVREINTPNSGMRDFLSYYLPGDGSGLVSLVFSEELDPSNHPVAEIQYGDQDNIELGLYMEYPPVTVDGNQVTVNLQGVTRFPEEMVPGLTPLNTIGLRISNIKSIDGQYVLTGSMSSPYSFGFSYNLKSVVYSIAADWTPVAGSALKGGDPMEIWVLNGQKIKFDSVDFAFVKDGVSVVERVPYESLAVETDNTYAGALVFTLAAPAIEADEDSEINVTFGGLIAADGLDHSGDIFVRYKSAPSAVEAIPVGEGSRVYFDLLGRRVDNPEKGIYICNGKKTVIK